MDGTLASQSELVGAGVILFVAVVAGTVIHELTHAAVLRAFAVPYVIEWLPARTDVGPLRASVVGGWARVRPRRLPPTLSPWVLRVAALAPLVMAVPLVLVPLGVAPDPFETQNPYLIAATIGWTACAIPSHQDFSLVWHAERALERGLTEHGS